MCSTLAVAEVAGGDNAGEGWCGAVTYVMVGGNAVWAAGALMVLTQARREQCGINSLTSGRPPIQRFAGAKWL
jgi:hypothetical protein